MKFLTACTLLLAASVLAKTRNVRRKLSFPSIVGYEPDTDVQDHANLDGDQLFMEKYLAQGTTDSFLIAQAVYEKGGFSKAYSQVTFTEPIQNTVLEDLMISGTTNSSTPVSGFAKDDVQPPVASIGFQYKQLGPCRVGGLAVEDQSTLGCLANTGSLDIETMGVFPYTSVTHLNGRTMQGFSTTAQTKMDGQVEYLKFVNYYQRHDYADHWVTSAFQRVSTQFPGGRGQADFSKYTAIGQAEVIKKGTAYMNVWMYVIREMEDALDDCVEGDLSRNEERVHAWDEAVAFYAGAIEGGMGSDDGVFPYRLAEKRCANFGTCGVDGTLTEGTSKVNLEIIQLFKLGNSQINQGRCSDAISTKNEIVKLMYVPLVQGTLRYAWKQEKEVEGENEKSEAEGAVFAAAILPIVYDCNKDDAAVIYDNMRVGFDRTEFLPVKKAFERQYKCMGIVCDQVGGLVDSGNGGYLDEADPCKGGGDKNKLALGLGLGLGIPLAIALLALLWTSVSRHSAGKEY